MIRLSKWAFLLPFHSWGQVPRPLLGVPTARSTHRHRASHSRVVRELRLGSEPLPAGKGFKMHSRQHLIYSPGIQQAFSVLKTEAHLTHRGRPRDSTLLILSESLSYLSSSPFPLKIVGVMVVCAQSHDEQ